MRFAFATWLASHARQDGDEGSGAMAAGPHFVQVPAPKLENLPAGQGSSVVASEGQNVPASQVRHSVGPSGESENDPAEQEMQEPAPLLLYLPFGHSNSSVAP